MSTPALHAIVKAQRSLLRVRLSTISIVWETCAQRVGGVTRTRATSIPEGRAFVFPPPAIPGIGTSGGVTFMLEDRSGQDVPFLAQQTKAFIEEELLRAR
jgi:hypothetical protein